MPGRFPGIAFIRNDPDLAPFCLAPSRMSEKRLQAGQVRHGQANCHGKRPARRFILNGKLLQAEMEADVPQVLQQVWNYILLKEPLVGLPQH